MLRSRSRCPTSRWAPRELLAVATDNLGLNSTSAPVSITVRRAVLTPLTVQLLHASDFEAGTIRWMRRSFFGGERTEVSYPTNTLILAGGDNFIPSPYFTASADPAAGLGGEKVAATSSSPTRWGAGFWSGQP